MRTIDRPTQELPLPTDGTRDERPRFALTAPETAPDISLVRASLEGDGSAFGQLVRRHDDNMRGVVWRVVESQAAMDDVLQDAYLKAWRSLAGFRGDSAFSSWLYAIVYRTAIDWRRSQRRLSIVPADQLAGTAQLNTPDHAAAIAQSFALRQALATLPADQLAVVALVDGEGRSYEQVATLLDISAGTVASRLHRGRAAVRSHLDQAQGEAR